MIRDKEKIDEIVKKVRSLVRESMVKEESRVEEKKSINDEIIEEMREMGIFGL